MHRKKKAKAALRYAQDPLPAAALRWRCQEGCLKFESTAEVEPIEGVVGQETAVEALTFGLEVSAPGQNVFVRGLTGTGRSTLIRRLLERVRPACPIAPDRCYVHNFARPDSPRLLTLPRGTGDDFRSRVDGLVDFIAADLTAALASDVVKNRGSDLERRMAAEIKAVTRPFDDELRAAGLTLVLAQIGPTTTRQLIVPLIDGEPATPERLEALRAEGALTAEQIEAMHEKIGEFQQRLNEVGNRVQKIQLSTHEALGELIEDEARGLLEGAIESIRHAFPDEKVKAFLEEVVEDVVTRRLVHLDKAEAFTELYRINLIEFHAPDEECPIIIENAPAVQTLIGTIDRSFGPDEASGTVPHMMIHSGSILRADGGYLILEARDVLSEPGAWRALIRTIRTGKVTMVATEGPIPWRVPPIKPEPIPVDLKVILLGDAQLYYMLDALDPDFPHYFKVLADFDDVIERNDQSLVYYAAILSRLAREEKLLPFSRCAVGALCEHGARIASRQGKLTTRFGRLADIAREAAFLATKREAPHVKAEDVQEAVRRTKRRANLPSRRYNEFVKSGIIRLNTSGHKLGQINGLAVMQAGPLTYGFPTRITATIGPGTAGTINIEREANLSGAIHTKGFYILGGLLRTLLPTDHPVAFDASIAFEQSYGGIDGDSASAAEMCCLLSALTDVPLRQDLAMTGAIDQVGNILPIGAVNEKIEGFYDICAQAGLTGTQGVVIPESNVGDLMLRQDVVDACAAGRFHVYAVDQIHQAIGLFMERVAGEMDAEDHYPEGSILGVAVKRAREFWELAVTAKDEGRAGSTAGASD